MKGEFVSSPGECPLAGMMCVVCCVLVGTSSVEVIHFRRLEGVVAGSVPADWGVGESLLTGVGECPC